MRSPLLIAALVALAGCSADPQKDCRVGADCASGVCQSNGTCAPETTAQLTGDAGAQDGGATTQTDGGSSATQDAGTDGGSSGLCVPNHDRIITAAELPIRAGLRATYKTAEDVTVSTGGTPDGDGGRVWSFEGTLTGDSSALWETESTATAWYSTDFPSATYAARLSSGSDNRGVFEVKSDGLYLLGVVSQSGTYPYTKLAYDPPVKVMALPLSEGLSWSTSTTVSGTYVGAFAYYTEQYDSQVDAHGLAKTPFGEFPVLRVRTVMVRSGNAYTTTRTFAFAAECFSAVAQVVSQAGETQVEFTSASEVRRLSP